ncbi:TPA: hypothetical protein SMF55_004838 [Serratia liquefaciens]|nr:hypothetical protein [Serratia liquefaciens]
MKLSMDNVIKSTNILFTTAAKEANHLFNPKKNGLANKLSSAKQSLHKLTSNKTQTKPDINPTNTSKEKAIAKIYADANKKEVNNSPESYGRFWNGNLIDLSEAQSAAKLQQPARLIPMDVPTVPTAVKNASPGEQRITQANGATDYRPPVPPKSQLVKDYVAKMNGHKPVEKTGEQSSHVKFDKPAASPAEADLQKMTQKELLREYLRSMDS